MVEYTPGPGVSLIHKPSGKTFPHVFTFANRRYWADARSVENAFGVMRVPANTTGAPPEVFAFRFKVKDGSIVKAGSVKEPTGVAADVAAYAKLLETAGEVISPGPSEVESSTSHRETGEEYVATVDFAGRRFGLDAAAIASRVAQLPDDTLIGLHVGTSGRVLSTAILRDEPPGSPRGHAYDLAPETPEKRLEKPELLRAGYAALALALPGEPSEVSLDPVPPETLAELYNGPDALDQKAGGVLVNAPIQFWRPGDDSTEAGMKLFPLEGIVLTVFRVPEGFGSKSLTWSEEGPVEKERVAAFLLVTAPGAIVSTRDKKNVEAAVGSIVWVDVKADLRPLRKYTPPLSDDGQPKAAHLVFLWPTHKAKFTGKNAKTGAEEPHTSWRIQLKWRKKITDPRHLRAIAAMALQCPDLVTSPVEEEEEEHDGEPEERAPDSGSWQ